MNKDNKNTELDNTDKKLHISDVIGSSNFTKEEASIYFQKKLFGLPSALQHTIFEAVYRIEHGGYDIQKVLDWYHKIEELYNSKF